MGKSMNVNGQKWFFFHFNGLNLNVRRNAKKLKSFIKCQRNHLRCVSQKIRRFIWFRISFETDTRTHEIILCLRWKISQKKVKKIRYRCRLMIWRAWNWRRKRRTNLLNMINCLWSCDSSHRAPVKTNLYDLITDAGAEFSYSRTHHTHIQSYAPRTMYDALDAWCMMCESNLPTTATTSNNKSQISRSNVDVDVDGNERLI